MTTEILLNKLFQIKSNTPEPQSSISFEMDIENELGCVVYDEIHMINDAARGHVWEQSIMMLPKHIQIIGLSATLDNPEKFALWLENKGEFTTNPEKIVYLASKLDRAVPLTHYGFVTTNTGIFKAVKDKSIQEEIKSIINKPFLVFRYIYLFNGLSIIKFFPIRGNLLNSFLIFKFLLGRLS
jgi:superfamily II RNA helicase